MNSFHLTWSKKSQSKVYLTLLAREVCGDEEVTAADVISKNYNSVFLLAKILMGIGTAN